MITDTVGRRSVTIQDLLVIRTGATLSTAAQWARRHGVNTEPSIRRKCTTGTAPGPSANASCPGTCPLNTPPAGRTPLVELSRKNPKTGVPSSLKTRTCVPPPSPAPVTIQSVLLSGLRTVLTYTPPAKDVG